MPIWAMIITDVVLTAAAIGVFMLFDYVMPQSSGVKGEVIATVDSSAEGSFTLPNAADNSQEESTAQDDSEPAVTTAPQTETATTTLRTEQTNRRNWGNQDTADYRSDQNAISSITNGAITSEELGSASTDNAQVTVYKKSIGESSNKITYFVADVYVTSASEIKAAFANGEFGKNIKDSVFSMAVENKALFAINGDFYGNSERSIVIRNGIKYRDDVNDADVCVLFTDGTMQTYSPSEYDSDAVIAKGAWQAWNFGPALLDGSGNVLETFNTTKYLNSANPRSAIGCVSAGHYIFVTVDGRNEGYSKGATLSELAAIMSDEGCMSAFNLDGGKSAMMYFNKSIVNAPDGGGRDLSDIIYIGG
jgi:hypothetical protein